MKTFGKSLQAADLLALLAWRLAERALRLLWALAKPMTAAFARALRLAGGAAPAALRPLLAELGEAAGSQAAKKLGDALKSQLEAFRSAMERSPAARRLLLLAAALIALRLGLDYMERPRGEWAAQGRAVASYYERGFIGKPTASGEPYSPLEMTAAHRTLPFGTWVRVKSLLDGREAVVRINDRGPFVEGRDIDLSKAAARRLGILKSGLAPVEMSILGKH